MSEPTDAGVVHAYARETVEEYLRSVATERAELERQIAAAQARVSAATAAAERSATLERKVGAQIVSAHARVRMRRSDAAGAAERILRPSPAPPDADQAAWAPPPARDVDLGPDPSLSVRVPDRNAVDFFQQLRASVDDGLPLGASMRPAWMAGHG